MGASVRHGGERARPPVPAHPHTHPSGVPTLAAKRPDLHKRRKNSKRLPHVNIRQDYMSAVHVMLMPIHHWFGGFQGFSAKCCFSFNFIPSQNDDLLYVMMIYS